MQSKEKKESPRKLKNPLKKKRRLEKILEAGKEIILEKGVRGLSFRALGEKLDMHRENILRYVDSKRDLWIAIRFSLYDDFITRLDKVVEVHKKQKKSYLELFVKISDLFLEFASENYNRFMMIFLLEPPEAKKRGRIERNMDYDEVTKFLFELLKEAVDANEIRESDVLKTYYAILSLLVGAIRSENTIKNHAYITEPLNVKSEINSISVFRNFILEKVREILENSRP
jgi:AcrR family transcriptional regulator